MQLALLSRAQRSLWQGDARDARRWLDEYEQRFPDGLLDRQVALLRESTITIRRERSE